ncbi:hypothetical protein CDW43_15150 [Methylophaga nitratireducenticrescens]|nr:hypothetical protein CDW43_15150 [Methylophaga nitratireducenticrescens]
MTEHAENDHTAAFAEAFYIANLLFVGFFYLALWALFFMRYKQTSSIAKHHLIQCLVVGTLSTSIFILINGYIILTTGYASLTALLSLELYFMLVVPIFLLAGIIGFTKAIKGLDYSYPLVGKVF